jgi:organic hydroperoxide reductase OsmC/OhrA
VNSRCQYTAHATARGQGRNGEVESKDGPGLKLRLAMPKALGGKEDGANPEQLFAVGYSGGSFNSCPWSHRLQFLKACLLGAIQMMARKLGKKDMANTAVVHASVHIGETEKLGGLGIAVDMKVEGVDDEVLQAGHEVLFLVFLLALRNLSPCIRRLVRIAAHSNTERSSMSRKRE